jgi:MFS family permease
MHECTPDAIIACVSADNAQRSIVQTAAISALGGVFEFYDFVIFAVFAPQIGRAFFPPEAGESSRTLQAFAVFAVGYLARPVGGMLWAHVGDRRGRAYVFSHTVLGMAACTLMIALLPGYATLGVAAPVLLVGLRLLQGMALGGEIPASLCWLSEHAGPRRVALVTALLMAGVNSGLLLGQGVAVTLEAIFGSEHAMNWAWRLAFVFGSSVGVIAYFVRRHVGETRQFLEMHAGGAVERLPLKTLLRTQPRALLSGFLMCSMHAWVVPSLYLTLPSFLVQCHGMELHHAERVALVASCLGSVVYVCSGWLADRVGARRVCVTALVVVAAAALPAYAMTTADTTWPIVALGAAAGAFVGAYLSLLPTLFPASVRVSGLATSYDGAAAIIGGSGPYLMLWMAQRHGSQGVAWLMVAFAAAALTGLATSARRCLHP